MRCVLRLAAAVCSVCAMSLPAAALEPKQQAASAVRVLFIGQSDGPSAHVDARIVAHLRQQGYVVEQTSQDTPVEAARGVGLVVISSSVAAKHVAPGWRELAVPLLTWENDLLDDLAMTGKRSGTDYGEAAKERYLWLVNAPHPLAACLSAGAVNVYDKQAPMSWGKPGLGAAIIATLYGQPEKVAIFGYEKGATMDYETLAPARRVMLFMDNDSFPNLSAAGLRLVDAAVRWASAGGIAQGNAPTAPACP